MRFKYALLVCVFGTRFWYGMRFRCALLVCTFGGDVLWERTRLVRTRFGCCDFVFASSEVLFLKADGW